MRIDSLVTRMYNRSYIKADLNIFNMDNKYLGKIPLGTQTLIPNGKLSDQEIYINAIAIFTMIPNGKEIVDVYISQWEEGKYEDTVIYKREYKNIVLKETL